MNPDNESEWRVLEEEDACLRDVLLDAITHASAAGEARGTVAHLRRRGDDEAVVVLTTLHDEEDEDTDEVEVTGRYSRVVVRHAR